LGALRLQIPAEFTFLLTHATKVHAGELFEFVHWGAHGANAIITQGVMSTFVAGE
jgi:hypothetical protein